MALGIAFSGPYKIESEPTMAMGETVKVGQFEVTFKNLYEGEGAGYIFLEGARVVRKDGKLIGIAAPQRRVYAKWGQMQFAEAAVIPSLGNEFYATLMAVDQQNRAVFRLSSNPLVNWLWIGGILMCLLPFVSFRRRNGRENDAAEARRNRKTLRRPCRAQEHLV
ncbi:MAG: cytochrome c-type biogenesis CcmF C-terminal domain-containing protein [Bilophila wadsworthia]